MPYYELEESRAFEADFPPVAADEEDGSAWLRELRELDRLDTRSTAEPMSAADATERAADLFARGQRIARGEERS